MFVKTTIVKSIAALALACGLSVAAQAQIGSGWKSSSPGYKIQEKGSGKVDGLNFSISNSNTSTEERAERRYDSYSSGQHQFEGTVKVNSLSGDRICLKQTFQESAGPFFLLAVKHDGTLYNVEGGQTLGKVPIGTSFRVNTVHDVSGKTLKVYINGSLKITLTGGSSPWYDKFGTYRTASGHGPVSATWSNVKFWVK